MIYRITIAVAVFLYQGCADSENKKRLSQNVKGNSDERKSPEQLIEDGNTQTGTDSSESASSSRPSTSEAGSSDKKLLGRKRTPAKIPGALVPGGPARPLVPGALAPGGPVRPLDNVHGGSGPSNPSIPPIHHLQPSPIPGIGGSDPPPSGSPSTPPENPAPVEIPFKDEFDEGGPRHPRVIPAPPALDALPPANAIGNAVMAFLSTGGNTPVDDVIESMIALFSPMVNRETGLFDANSNHMEFWAASNGQALLEFAAADCGENVVDEDSPKTMCYLAMMLGTHVPVPAGYKPRDVSRQIGLFEFCENNKDGIANELRSRAKDPVRIEGFGDDPLPQHHLTNEEVVRESLTRAFAATWLSFCPNLVDALEPVDRLKVFNHAMYRMQIASLHTGGHIDAQFSRHNVVRDQALADIMNGNILTQGRVQQLRRPIHTIQFGGSESQVSGRGVQTDWASEIGEQIFQYSLVSQRNNTQTYHLFSYQSDNEYIVITPGTWAWAERANVTETARNYYKAAGRYIGWMFINNYQIPEDLSIMFYAKLMGRVVGWEAIKVYDNEKFVRLDTCLNGNDAQVATAGCVYIVASAIDYVDENDQVNPWPPLGGDLRRNVLDNTVTNSVTLEVPDEFRILVDGIYDVIPQHVFECGITTRDLRLRILGERNVDVTDLIANLGFVDYAADSPQIIWLCEYLREFDQKRLQQFVKFVTNKRRPGQGGFAATPIQIKRMDTIDLGTIPKSHTCYYQIELPAYATREILRDRIDYVLPDSEFGDENNT